MENGMTTIQDIVQMMREDYMKTQEYADLSTIMHRYTNMEVLEKIHLGFRKYVARNEQLDSWGTVRSKVLEYLGGYLL